MPSWPARLISHQHSSNSHTTSNHNVDQLDNHGQRPRFPNRPVASSNNAPLVPITSDLPEPNPSHPPSPPRSRSGHGRSISNPFPTLFGPGKKSDRATATGSTIRLVHDSESSDEEFHANGDGNGYTQTRPRNDGEGNMVTGKCFTCDALMQWPRDLNAFRCTRCMTTNDLKPAENAWAARGQSGVDPNAVRTGTGSKPAGLSTMVTQSIIDRCITKYLHARRSALANKEVVKEGLSHQVPPTSKSSLVVNGTGEWPIEQQRPHDNHHPSRLPSTNTKLSQALPRPEAHRRWDMNPGMKTGAEMCSTSLPGWIPSPMEHMLRNEIGNEGPAMSTRQPPPSSASTSRQRQSGKHSLDATIRSAVREPPARYLEQRLPSSHGSALPRPTKHPDRVRSIFEPVEEYIITCFGSWDCINSSFSTARPKLLPRSVSDDPRKVQNSTGADTHALYEHAPPLSSIDAKTLLIGDFAENGSWWTGHRGGGEARPSTALNSGDHASAISNIDWGVVTPKTPHIDWVGLNDWYQLILRAGGSWRLKWEEIFKASGNGRPELPELLQEIEYEVGQARLHLQRTLLKATESLLKRPGRRLKSPPDIRFLLILLANPLLYGSSSPTTRASRSKSRGCEGSQDASSNGSPTPGRRPSQLSKEDLRGPGQLSGIIKRILGLIANLPTECHHVLITWFSRFSEGHFRRLVDLINSFVGYRLGRQQTKKKSGAIDPTAGLIPDLGGPGQSTSAQLHAALGIMTSKGADTKAKILAHSDDWQIKAAAKVMALLFAANNSGAVRRIDSTYASTSEVASSNAGLATKQRAYRHGQMIPINAFYNTMLDYCDLVADFEAWESRRTAFSFSQYPFFLSIWAKIRIMEYDARRQMELKAREAFFDSIMNRKEVSQHLVLKVRRDCLVEDSLRGVSEVIGAGQEEIKKGLRIDFVGEEGVDAGGLRKEWFLLLVRDVFDPNHGLFLYDEDSHYCYFNPHCFETSDQFFLVGVLLGLAIYNTTNLDISLPPFIFKKLLASAPSTSAFSSASRGALNPSLEDLAEYRPALAKGLQQLLDYEGNVEEVFCRDFVAETERYGQTIQTPLCAHGEKTAVTNANRREFVDLYVRYLLDTAVARQFEPFKRGFYTVCGGNALSLFRPEEIELLVRGSDEALDVSSLRGVASYENWAGGSSSNDPSDTEAVVGWFWDFFGRVNARDQRKILSFITGSDRIPAMGATSLSIKICCLGDDCERFPVARTCFNSLCLWRYGSRAKLERKLWTAVVESEGFGLK
ncbi:MAG: putative E3 ubiquitin-protein ligase [Peltula sp. TS41687]|nr:MAG: putative E3 ubiquitin-protein ligase [Peltula sp. TS41687]